MASFFRLVTAHGDEVALQGGRLVACRRGGVSDAVAVVGLRVGEAAVLTANVDAPMRFAALDQTLAAALLMLHAVTEPGRMALIDAGTYRYLSGPPVAPTIARIAAADTLQQWEWFTPQDVGDLTVHAGAVARLSLMRNLLAEGLTAAALARFIMAAQEGSAQALDAALAMMETATLDDLATRVVDDAGLCAALGRLYPGDPWAQTALPDLVASRARPSPAPAPGFFQRLLRSRPEPAPARALPARRQVIGPEFDVLGAAGTIGEFASLPHACNSRARRLAPAGEGVAVLATARNEGIYLLEWIAHHRCLGARGIYIYSNDNQDGSDELLGALADAGVITWIRSELGGGVRNAQFKAYGHALGCMPDLLAYEWVLVVDIDEFLVLDRLRFAGLEEFGRWHRRRGADTVAINWQFMAPEEGSDPCAVPLTRRNTRVLGMAQCGEGVRLVKSMSRPNRVVHSEAHVPFADERAYVVSAHASGTLHEWHNPPAGFGPSPKFADRIVAGPAVVNHYICKSAAEWMWKLARNRGDHALVHGDMPRPMDEASAHQYLRELTATGLAVDERALAQAGALEAEIGRITDLGAVAAAAAGVRARHAVRMAAIRGVYAGAAVAGWGDEARGFLRLAGLGG